MTNVERRYENRVRKLATRHGFRVHKSRARSIHANNLGEYMLVHDRYNCVALGGNYDTSLGAIEEFLLEQDRA